jgi:deoxyribose-phosphate aldolase
MYAHEHLQADFLNRDAILSTPASPETLAALVDHTLLRPDAAESEFRLLVQQAAAHNFRSVCVPSSAVRAASGQLKQIFGQEQQPLVCTVVGFPHGNANSESKIAETAAARGCGAAEFDYVQNQAWVRAKNWNALTGEAQALVGAAAGGLVKVILETAFLTQEEIFESALAAARGGVHVLKTSTGFSSRGASLEDLNVLSLVAAQIEKEKGIKVGIKASGGIKSLDDALKMIRAGATRLGTSAGVALMSGKTPEKSSY